MIRLDGRLALARAEVFTGRAAHLAAFSDLVASAADGTRHRCRPGRGPDEIRAHLRERESHCGGPSAGQDGVGPGSP